MQKNQCNSVPSHFQKLVIISELLFPTFTCHVPLDWKLTFFQIHLYTKSFIFSWHFFIYFLFLIHSTTYTQLSTLSTQSGWSTEHAECLFNPTRNLGAILVKQRWMNLTAKWWMSTLLSSSYVMSYLLLNSLIQMLLSLLQMPWDVA